MAAQQRGRRRWPLFVAAGFLASAALVPGLGHAVDAGAQKAAQTPVPAATVVPPALPVPLAPQPAFGAYLHYDALGVARMAGLSRWLNGAQPRVGHTYLPGDLWSNIEGEPRFLDVWAAWRRERDDRMFVLNVPMMERNEEGLSDDEVRALLRRGAAGEFDGHYRRLAERLVALGVPDTVLVLGWEMNGTTYAHRCGPDPEAWKAYWNRIVNAMRSVTGQQFRFDFAPSRGRDAIPWTECYPGDATVDIIGMDSYDQPQGLSFEGQVTEPYGLQDHVDFAKEHGKPISYPEWGLFRNGDNAEYMRRMLAWIDEHKPLYHTITDYCPHGVWQCGRNPQAAEVYRSVLSGSTGPLPLPLPLPTPVLTPQPAPVPPPSPNCSPLGLGDWIESWLGGRVCIRSDWWSRIW
ncbi:glycosyl hydrolase [Streptomyces coeruleorubidus]|uniref:glycoside hydrolase family 26 protein n=1 Tax=Streptomyces coeruleorubidus TaxID=116188 RepID=UPI00237F4564|nr:glycosyl hydrolase [Streptomyces coeruleorubidus]WDV51825.1 glycosyl hydrolase [Streptomyces coeruleorubidus]